LLLCLILAVGCARVHMTFAPSPIAQNRLLQLIDANGVSTWALLPPNYNPQTESPWIIYDHGFGQTISSIVSDPLHSWFVQSLAAAGFVVVASEYRNITCWGDMECAEDVANLQTLWRSRLNLSLQPFVIGESMGGIVSWNAISHGTVKPLAVAGIYPVCNLASMYAERALAPTIQTAYDVTSPSDYAAATRGFDPILTPPSTFAGIPIQMWASYSDRTVLRSQNEDPFANAINAAGGSVTIHTSRGDHGDPSNLDPPAIISFFSSHMP
jgi:hypothetical protein